MGSTGKGVLVCVNKFSVKPSSQYSYSEMGSKIFYRCFEVDDVGNFAAGKPVPAAQRAKTSIPIHPRGLSAGRADPFVPGGRLTAYRLALTVKGSGYGPGSRTLSPACSTPGATTPGVVPPTPPGPALPAPEESTYTRAKCQQGRRPNPSCRSGPDVSPCDGCDE